MQTIGVDVGGTFTDLVCCDMESGQVVIHKVSTTPRTIRPSASCRA